MSLRRLPEPRAFARPSSEAWDMHPRALDLWRPLAAEADNGATLSIYDAIGEDPWTGEGMTAKRVAGVLRSIGEKPLTVNVNSPGGSMWEGVAIYNLLREHPAEVTVRVMGIAASAASLIAMAADRVEMGNGSFLMIHNAWAMLIGNQHEMRATADLFAEFDAAQVDIYEARTGLQRPEIEALMAAETYMRPETAMAKGFADATFDAPDYDDKPETKGKKALARLDATLAKAGLPRSERRQLLREAAGTPSAAGTATPSAGFDEGAVARLLSTLKA